MRGMACLIIPVDVPPEDFDEEYPSFAGVMGSPEHSEYLKLRRADQKRRSSSKSKAKAKARVEADKHASLTWQPIPFVFLPMAELGMSFPSRWMCDQFIRGCAARDGVQRGINIKMNHEKVTATCRSCKEYTIVFNLQPSNFTWKLKQLSNHPPSCFGLSTPADGASSEKARPCKSAYTAAQMARLVLGDAASNPNISTQRLRAILTTKAIFSRPPNGRFFGGVKKQTIKMLNANRIVSMAALEGYAALLRSQNHKVICFTPCIPFAFKVLSSESTSILLASLLR